MAAPIGMNERTMLFVKLLDDGDILTLDKFRERCEQYGVECGKLHRHTFSSLVRAMEAVYGERVVVQKHSRSQMTVQLKPKWRIQ